MRILPKKVPDSNIESKSRSQFNQNPTNRVSYILQSAIMGRELQKKKNRSSIPKVRQKPKSKRVNPLGNPVIAKNWLLISQDSRSTSNLTSKTPSMFFKEFLLVSLSNSTLRISFSVVVSCKCCVSSFATIFPLTNGAQAIKYDAHNNELYLLSTSYSNVEVFYENFL